MLKRPLIVAFLTVLPCVAAAQVFQSGSVTAGNCANWAGTNLIADSGAPCNAAAGSNGQLQWNNSGALGGISGSSWNGTTLTLPNSIAAVGNLSLTGGLSKVVAPSGGDFTSPVTAVNTLGNMVMSTDANVTVTENQGTYSISSPINIFGKIGAEFAFQGADQNTTSVTAVGTCTGSAGAYSCPLTVSDASHITQDSSGNYPYLGISGASGGTNPLLLNGPCKVTAVSGSTVTCRIPELSASTPTGAISATVYIVDAVNVGSNTDVLDVWNGMGAVQLGWVALIGDGTAHNCLSPQDIARVLLTGPVIAWGCGGHNILMYLGSEMNGTPPTPLFTGASGADGLYIADTATVLAPVYASGNAGNGAQARFNSTLDATAGGCSVGNGSNGWYANNDSFANLVSTCGANNATKNYSADTQSTLNYTGVTSINGGVPDTVGFQASSGITMPTGALLALSTNYPNPFSGTGVALNAPAATWTDSTTAPGTVPTAYFMTLRTPTLATSGNAITVSAATTLDIKPPAAGSHVTISNDYALTLEGQLNMSNQNLSNVNGIFGNNSSGPEFRGNTAASATNCTLIPNRADLFAGICADAAGDVTIGTDVSGTTVNNTTFSGKYLLQAGNYTVAGLPSCTSSLKGAQAIVTDANAPTYLGALTGSGTTVSRALCNGTAWVSD
ncbi:MAG TPA: hypothetical protein VMU22_04465 [Rhizomicrobium sp.]|nr:hypothetical protein [Rhizomicrobium sp.]